MKENLVTANIADSANYESKPFDHGFIPSALDVMIRQYLYGDTSINNGKLRLVEKPRNAVTGAESKIAA